jgi:hypothetical protein
MTSQALTVPQPAMTMLQAWTVDPFAVWFRRNYLKLAFASIITLALVFIGMQFANATAPTLNGQVATAFTNLTTLFNAMMDLAWPVVGAVATGLWLVGVFLRIVFKI